MSARSRRAGECHRSETRFGAELNGSPVAGKSGIRTSKIGVLMPYLAVLRRYRPLFCLSAGSFSQPERDRDAVRRQHLDAVDPAGAGFDAVSGFSRLPDLKTADRDAVPRQADHRIGFSRPDSGRFRRARDAADPTIVVHAVIRRTALLLTANCTADHAWAWPGSSFRDRSSSDTDRRSLDPFTGTNAMAGNALRLFAATMLECREQHGGCSPARDLLYAKRFVARLDCHLPRSFWRYAAE